MPAVEVALDSESALLSNESAAALIAVLYISTHASSGKPRSCARSAAAVQAARSASAISAPITAITTSALAAGLIEGAERAASAREERAMRGIHFQLRAVAWPRFVAPSGFGLVELEGGLGAPLPGPLARGVVLRTVPLPRGEALRAAVFGPSGMEKSLFV